jgi:hypothetical protein
MSNTTTVLAARSEWSPERVADLLDGVLAAMQETDHELAHIVRRAREDIRVLSWNRYAARHNRLGARRDFIRHHKTLLQQRAR